MFLSEWRDFLQRLALQEEEEEKKQQQLDDSLLKSRASPDMLPFSLCNKKRLAIGHINRPLIPTTLSIPSYDVGK